MTKKNNLPEVFEYTEYRSYLKDWFEMQKPVAPYLSFRYLARKTGVDAGYLVRVFQGSKHLNENAIQGFIDLIGFSVQRSKYFFELVLFNKAKGEIEIRERYERLLSLRDSSARVLQNKEFTYFSKWYYPAVRLCMLNAPFTGDYQELAQRLSPPIEEQEAREAVSTLETLGLIKNTPAGWEVLDSHLSTGDAWSNLAIREFQRTMLQRAGESLYTHSKENREIATLSLAIPRAEIATLQDMMQEFRKKVAQWALSLEDSDCVMQFNLSCFPLSLPPLNEQESQRAVSGELES